MEELLKFTSVDGHNVEILGSISRDLSDRAQTSKGQSPERGSEVPIQNWETMERGVNHQCHCTVTSQYTCTVRNIASITHVTHADVSTSCQDCSHFGDAFVYNPAERQSMTLSHPEYLSHDCLGGVWCTIHSTPCRTLINSGSKSIAIHCTYSVLLAIYAVISVLCSSVSLRIPQFKNSALPSIFSSSWSSLSVLLLMLSNATTTHAQTWRVPPQNTAQHMGNNTRLTCGLQDLAGKSLIWSQLYHNGTSLGTLFVNDVRWTTNPRYNVTLHVSTPGVSGYDLLLTGLEPEDDKIYSCDVQTFEHRQASVTVLIAPGFPTLDVSNMGNLREGDNATFTCTTSGGNPTPSVMWLRNGVELGTGTVSTDAQFGTTTSVLRRTLSRADNGAIFRCDVTNSAMTSPRSTEVQIAVRYKPVLGVSAHNPLMVVEQSPVTLTCSVDAYPPVTPATIEWRKNGALVGMGPTYNISATLPGDAGEYSCTASNTVGTSTTSLQLVIHYAPIVSIQYSDGELDGTSALRINENHRLNLTCDVTANPAVELSTVEWRKDGSFIKTGPWLNIQRAARTDSGLYSCVASNVLQPSEGPAQPETASGELQVYVQYRPGHASVQVPAQAIKDSPVVLNCSVNDTGLPAATLRWTRSGSQTILQTGTHLELSPARLEHTGQYICTPGNSVGDGVPGVGTLQILEHTEWLNTGIPASIERTVDDRALKVVCSVRGIPAPTVTWYKDGQSLDGTQGYFVNEVMTRSIETYSYNVTSTLLWEGSSRSPYEDSLLSGDSGGYVCSARNDIDTTDIRDSTQLAVYYPPVLNTSSDKVAIDPDQDAVLHCRAHSLPDTIFTWKNGSTELVNGGRINIRDTYTPGSEYPYESTLTIMNVRATDFSVYTCVGANSQGQSQIHVQLTVKTVPDSPTSLVTSEVTWESVALEWSPGFDGGYTQIFTIIYTGAGVDVPQSVAVGGAIRYNVTHLFPSINYTFRVHASNQLGSGDPSNPVAAQTEDFTVEPVEDGEVTYNERTHTLTFSTPLPPGQCARIDIHDTQQWYNYLPCEPTDSGSVKIDANQRVEQMRVSACLETRLDICSESTLAAIVEQGEDLPTYVVIIIGVICAFIVVALTLVLVILCYKRRQAIKKYEEQMSKPQNGTTSNGGGPRNVEVRGYDNPELESPQHSPAAYEERKSPVFSTQPSHQGPEAYDSHYYHQHNGNGYVPNGGAGGAQFSYENQNNLRRERSFKNSGGGGGGGGHRGDVVDGQAFPMHPTSRNNSTADKSYLHLDDPYSRSVHNSSGDGSMGSDQMNKPKKVMYEVVV